MEAVSTQMGNQGGYNTRAVEHVWAGTLGGVEAIPTWGGGGSNSRPQARSSSGTCWPT